MTARLFATLLIVALLTTTTACQREASEAGQVDRQPAVPGAVDDPGIAETAPRNGAEDAADDVLPALRVTALDGSTWDLADHRGQWVVVNFWATWCRPCLEEMPELSALGTMRAHIDVVGLAWEEITPEAMRGFLEQHPVAYPVAIIGTDRPPTGFQMPRGLPMTYLIAPDGSVARRFLGPVTALELENAIAAAGGPAVPEQ